MSVTKNIAESMISDGRGGVMVIGKKKPRRTRKGFRGFLFGFFAEPFQVKCPKGNRRGGPVRDLHLGLGPSE